ncbi:hypothetical protein Ccar_24500 [Clostridium carboxidivorans P7]|uniref:DUF1659 domain-containing protein n=1 Tax=Clostridium carboxidivorans P7 TaxID=536227 RepID=C6PU67_9CLOT|nr:DUF1659 domain-containing protein [Clostridium carboxidivorans]AKN33816.1 hypothetical protein Ccar_24500 [Clostridium carboxidivorans P7]EET87267.1 protein of unknown function DUF1659 [Clostridium carboxidivorans P7]EFG86573.1 hypothetical protein CLCAR_3520 [Clostridium carboxidivorans P7]
MAAKSTKLESSMVLKYKDGTDKNGKDKIKKLNFSKVKTSAVDQDVFDVAKSIETLLGKTLNELIRVDQNGITNA